MKRISLAFMPVLNIITAFVFISYPITNKNSASGGTIHLSKSKALNMGNNNDSKWQYCAIPEGNWSYDVLNKQDLLAAITRETGRDKIPPYFRVKKQEEEGNFHFAKDYTELKDITEDPFLYGQLYFSDKPFGNNSNGARTGFTSHDAIYGRLEVNGGKFAEVFGIPDKKDDKKVRTIGLRMQLYYGDKLISSSTASQYLLISDDDKEKRAINFDVKPDASKVSSVFPLDFYAGDYVYNAPLYYMHNVNEGANFKKPGKYTVRHIFFNKVVDAWGNEKKGLEREVIADFEYEYKESDVPAIIKAHKETTERVKAIFLSVDKLPEVFAHPAKVNDAEVTYEKIKTILKRDLPDRTIMKVAIAEGAGPLWEVEKNDLGLPRQKWFNRKIHIAYKWNDKCYVGTVDLIHSYTGGGGYGPLQVGYTSEKDKLIDCSKVK
jgi:hypothetical protein